MKYAILCWDGTAWTVLHYSHNWEDTERMLAKYKSSGLDAAVFVDARIIDFHEGMIKARELAKKLREKNAVTK